MNYNGTTIACSLAVLLFAAAGLRLTALGKQIDAGAPKVMDSGPSTEHGSISVLPQLPEWPRNLFSLAPVAGDGVTGSVKASTASIAQQLPTLVGVITDSKQRLAIINYNGKLRRVRETDEVSVWTVTKIKTRAVLLRSGDQLHELVLDAPVTKK
jgi:hypothetical protein